MSHCSLQGKHCSLKNLTEICKDNQGLQQQLAHWMPEHFQQSNWNNQVCWLDLITLTFHSMQYLSPQGVWFPFSPNLSCSHRRCWFVRERWQETYSDWHTNKTFQKQVAISPDATPTVILHLFSRKLDIFMEYVKPDNCFTQLTLDWLPAHLQLWWDTVHSSRLLLQRTDIIPCAWRQLLHNYHTTISEVTYNCLGLLLLTNCWTKNVPKANDGRPWRR